MATKTSDEPALMFFIRAQEYLSAADELLRSPNRPEAVNAWWHPIYFCYSHAAELALKAFWRSHNPEVKHCHSLTDWYEKCREKGLVIDENESGHIIRLLDTANEDSGYRYFIREGMVADLDWTQEVVTRLLQAVQARVAETEKCGPFERKLRLSWGWVGKPVKK
jgi:hypothetical protein